MSVLSHLARQTLFRENFSSISRQSIRQFRQKRKPNALKDNPKGPVIESEPLELPPAKWTDLVRPVIFTIGFGGASIAGCAVWQYENMRSEAMRTKLRSFGLDWGAAKKAGDFREEVRKWWSNLNDGEKLFWPLCGVNIAVFLAWRIPGLQPFMTRWFMSNPGSQSRCLPLLLNTFSHFGLIHLGCNMIVLHSFMPNTVHLMGKEQFLALYLNSGVISSLASMVYKVAQGKTSYSLGASGAICGVVGTFAAFYPDARMSLLFLPMYTFSAATAVKGLMALDAAGLALGWRVFDHMAHLSGVLCGLGWAYYGAPLLWARRERLVTAWHNLRPARWD